MLLYLASIHGIYYFYCNILLHPFIPGNQKILIKEQTFLFLSSITWTKSWLTARYQIKQDKKPSMNLN